MIYFSIQLFAWFAGLAVLMSFIEHQVHRRLMHRKNFLSSRFQAFKKMFEHHAIIHHVHYHKDFSDEPVAPGKDRHIRLSIKEGFLEALPISALIALVSWQGAIVFEIVVCLHHFLWNKIHIEMHKPEKRYFSNWSAYKFLARHHYLHHIYPDKNFNVVFPLADYVLGTNVHATNADLQGMSLLGIL